MRGYNYVQAVICSNVLDRILCFFHYRQTPTMDEPIDRPWFTQGVQVPIDLPVGVEPQLHLDQMLHQDEIDMYERRYGSIR